MEDEKKKRKNNKKKKNKQQQQQQQQRQQLSSNAGGDSTSQDHNHNNNNHGDVAVDVVVIEEEDKPTTISNTATANANGCISVDLDKENWVQEQAKLRDMVKQLLYEKDSYLQGQADLDIKIKQLLSENDSWRQKEVNLEQRISELVQEKDSLILEKSNAQERVREIQKERVLLIEKENSNKEIMATLNNENTRLRMQVMELEGAKHNLSQENYQLLDNMSSLQSRIQDLERILASAPPPADVTQDASEKEELNSQIEAACALVEKLVTENAELVEKLNELYMELGPRSASVANVTLVEIPDHAVGSVSNLVPHDSTSMKNDKLPEIVPAMDVDSNCVNTPRHSSDTTVSGEIVQISLDENEAQNLEAPASTSEGEDESVPLTSAPLIGAPFRLISFVASYVSGSDLVDKSSSDSLR